MTEASTHAGLTLNDLARETARFGVAEEQVRHDHAISHIPAALSRRAAEDFLFFGGTALGHQGVRRMEDDGLGSSVAPAGGCVAEASGLPGSGADAYLGGRAH